MDYNTLVRLVTGASGGLGEQFARALAERGADVILVARSADRLDTIAGDLRARHPESRFETIPLDLSVSGAGARLCRATHALSLQVDLLINNAGAVAHGDFADTPVQRSFGALLTHLWVLEP